MQQKICTKCKQERDIAFFSKDIHQKSGIHPICKICRRKSAAEYHLKNRDRIINKTRQWYQNNTERALKTDKQYRLKNKETLKERDAKYYLANKQKIIKRGMAWSKQKRSESPQFRLKCNLRKRLWDALRCQSVKKDIKTFDLVGCSQKELFIHIEKQFSNGMAWENYGNWEVDHIIPCSNFDFKDPIQQRACFHYTNLQPLWSKDNRSKSDKLNWPKPPHYVVQTNPVPV